MLFTISLTKEIHTANVTSNAEQSYVFPYWKDILMSGPKMQSTYLLTLDRLEGK